MALATDTIDRMSHPYVVEEFAEEDNRVLLRYFTNVDKPVFALKNLPEIVKGALFARYSRSGKSLRRLFLDEFYKGEDFAAVAEIGSDRASELYDRIFIEFGDDSVAQLGGAHVAVEQGSNILTKAIERGRLAAYLEQSTRYVPYDDQPGGRFRYLREADIMSSVHGRAYEKTLDEIFELYATALPKTIEGFKRKFPQQSDDTERVYRQTIRAKALDALRGMLPAATVSNTGIFASGQAYESMLLRMRGSALSEVRDVAEAILTELNQVIPVFLQRLDQPSRGGVWADYLTDTDRKTRMVATQVLSGMEAQPRPSVTLLEWDHDAENKLIAAMLYSVSDLPEDQIAAKVVRLSAEDRRKIVDAYVGDRVNRRHRPGRALERIDYRFDVMCDYGAFRDLQRHRMLTMEWQDLTPRHGYSIPNDLEDLGVASDFTRALDLSGELWSAIHPDLPPQAQYAVCMGYRIRFVMQLNAREAMHLIELRSSPQGHPAYRSIAHELHRQIREVAGHSLVADMMKHVDFSEVDLERLEAERKAERKRQKSSA